MQPPARKSPPNVAPSLGPYRSWSLPPGIMVRAKINPHRAYAQVASALVRYDQPSFDPTMAEPAGCWSSAMRLAFQTLQAYRMPRHRFTAVPAKVTTQARSGTVDGWPMPLLLPE